MRFYNSFQCYFVDDLMYNVARLFTYRDVPKSQHRPLILFLSLRLQFLVLELALQLLRLCHLSYSLVEIVLVD